MIYLITYELNQKDKDYSGFYNEIKSDHAWWHYIDTTWLIKTEETPQQISDRLLPYLNKETDNLLIIKVDPTIKQGWLSKEAWKWVDGW
jgi:hypothetical protein